MAQLIPATNVFVFVYAPLRDYMIHAAIAMSQYGNIDSNLYSSYSYKHHTRGVIDVSDFPCGLGHIAHNRDRVLHTRECGHDVRR